MTRDFVSSSSNRCGCLWCGPSLEEISNAYEVLSDDQKKAVYDQYGEAGLKGGMVRLVHVESS
jgi:hypothetical protein